MSRPATTRTLPLVVVGMFLLPAMLLRGAEPKTVPPDHAKRIKAGLELFQKQVRPLLVKHCLDCHGGKSLKADFDLSSRKFLMDSGHVEKTAKESNLLDLLNHTAEPHMPHKQPKLPAAAIASIAKWIDLGAPYDKPLVEKKGAPTQAAMVVTDKDRQFWSFQPLKRVTVPQVKNEEWCHTPIDSFILSRLEAKGLQPNDVAAKRKLIRRAYFDLVGLPPSPEDVQAFLNDKNPRAYETLIERLLTSKHYGERQARHWMDVARFAESHGYEQDYDRPNAYHYRDFLIKAFNQDLPFDQFARWQIAGDELAPENPLAVMATGFLGAGAFPTQLTETEFESARYDEMDDMLSTTSATFLGLTVGCCRCHDHKFDPFPTRDYYSLLSTFGSTIRSEIELPIPPDDPRKIVEYKTKLAELEAKLREYEQGGLPGEFSNWLKSAKVETGELSPWQVLAATSSHSTGGTLFQAQPDGSLLASGKTPAKEVLTFKFRTDTENIRAIRLEALAHPSLPQKGPGRAANGNFALGNIDVTIAAPKSTDKPQPVKLVAAKATHQQNTSSLSVAASIDNDPVSGWAVDSGGIGKDQAAVFTLDKPIGVAGGAELTIVLTLNHPNAKHTIGRPRFSISTLERPPVEVGKSKYPPAVLAALKSVKQSGDRTSTNWTTAVNWFKRSHSPGWKKLSAELEKYRTSANPGKKSKVQVTSEGFPHMKHHADGRGYPHYYKETYFLIRGDVKQKGPVVDQSFLQVLMRDGKQSNYWQIEKPSHWTRTSYRRASFANWMTDTEFGAGHLLARVIVNRVWQHHFGQGIVASPNDFGFQGERPTHPELLDWLAADFIQSGWKLKRLHTLIMTSAVYQQSSQFDERRAKIDRDNKLHWRRTPQRLEGEAIRDAMLSVSGLLDETMYGPGTLDANMKRRSVYFFIKRSKLIPLMMLFDWPEHLVSIGSRSQTTIAPQALMFMNSPQARQSAEALARRLQKVPGDKGLNKGYQLTINRDASTKELELADRFLKEQAAIYRDKGQKDPELLALVDFCQILFSMNEFVYMD